MSSDPVGSLAEEAAKLIVAIQGWAEGVQAATEPEAGSQHDPEHSHDPVSAECRFCPFCTAVRLARATTPEVRDHFSSAVSSLALAVKGLLDDPPPPAAGTSPAEKIDLAED